MTSPDLVDSLRARLPEMLDAVEALVSIESPSADHDAVAACADRVAELGGKLLGEAPEVIPTDGVASLRWTFGHPRVLLLGHLDTVWPLGTLAGWPFSIDRDGDRATGPGIFDMKAGLVQGFYALAALDDLDGVCVLVTGDEELGSPSTRDLIEETAGGLDAVFVLEASAAGALKTGRKGVSIYDVEVEGREAHAGLEPEKGVNALVDLAGQVLAIAALSRPELGTTVTPTVARAGTTRNTVPRLAEVLVDARCATLAEQERVDREIRALAPRVPGATVRLSGGPNRPPLEEAMSAGLFDLARSLATELGIGPIEGVAVGGGSDGNFTAGLGVPTLDGLGAVGDGAHARGEHVVVSAMPERAALVAALVSAVRGRGG